MGEFGQLLREAREKKGLSFAQVEEDTRIRQALVEALEEEDFGKLPSGIYRKGLLRSYALYLGLDPNEVMSLYGGEDAETGPMPKVAEGFEPPKGMAITSWLFIDLFLGLLIVASAVVAGSLAYNRWRPTLPASSTTPTRQVSLASPVLQFTPTDTPSPTGTATQVPSGRLQVDVQIISRTWLEVTVDGQPAFRGLIEAGTNWSWFAEDSIAMHVGNASGVLVTLNGQVLGPLGEEAGQVVDIEWTWENLNATPEPVPPSGTAVVTGTAVLTPSPAP
ncbi:MAG TPA: RodZ domain-containing protein [Anaerolineae bacterium]|nr:RodZ domain-containing protein [Anaerolineae bacterium]